MSPFNFSRESVVVGAINTPNNWSLRPLHPNDGARLLERCSKIIPSLRHAKILKERIGLRPVRKWGVRIELEMMEGPGIKVRKDKTTVKKQTYTWNIIFR